MQDVPADQATGRRGSGKGEAVSGGLLDGLTIISAIMQEQGCNWDEARRLWNLSMEVDAERQAEIAEAAVESNVIPFRAKH
jgi:hypothetical protein